MDIAKVIGWFLIYKYPIIFILTLVEGPIVMTMAGFILKLGYASFWPLYATLILGDLVADIIWYTIGYHYAHPLAQKYGRFFNISEELLDKTAKVFRKNEIKILLLSKLTMGFGFALLVLTTAGMVRVPFKKFIAFNAIGQLAWTGLLMAVGYYFGNFYLTLNKDLKFISLAAFVITLFIIIWSFNQYLRQRDLQNQL